MPTATASELAFDQSGGKPLSSALRRVCAMLQPAVRRMLAAMINVASVPWKPLSSAASVGRPVLRCRVVMKLSTENACSTATIGEKAANSKRWATK